MNGTNHNNDIDLAIFNDLLNERRSRREPEHGLMFAQIGYTAAVIWGVATLATIAHGNHITAWGAGITAIGSLVITITIAVKVWKTHEDYMRNRDAIVDFLAGAGQVRFVPPYMRPANDPGGPVPNAGPSVGVTYSLWVIGIAGFVAVAFSLAVLINSFRPQEKALATSAALCIEVGFLKIATSDGFKVIPKLPMQD